MNKFNAVEMQGFKLVFNFRILSVLFLIVIGGFANSCTITEIDENEKGVKFERYNGGINPDIIYGSGRHIYLLWDKMIIYNIDVFTHEEYFSFTTTDDLRYEINLLLSYNVVPNRIGYLENQIGRDYYHLVIVPEVERAISSVLSKQSSTAIPLMELDELGAEILKIASRPIREQYIELIDISINEISSLD